MIPYGRQEITQEDIDSVVAVLGSDALGIGPDDEVWTSPITFVASANCARYCGSSVDFVDIGPQTYNMSADVLEEKLKERKQSGGKLPSVVIPVHL